MGRYCYSREIKTIEGAETFAIVEAASFDEAKKEVDKGIRDRRLELADKHFGIQGTSATPQVAPVTAPSSTGAGYTAPNASTASNTPADLPDSPDKLPEGEEGQGAGGAS